MPFDQRLLFALRKRRRRLDGAAQIASEPIGLAQRQVFGRGANGHAFDQLLDALDLLAQRALGRGAPLLGPQPHASSARRQTVP